MKIHLKILLVFFTLSQYSNAQTSKAIYSINLEANGDLDEMGKTIVNQVLKENFSLSTIVFNNKTYNKTLLASENNSPIANSDNFTLYHLNNKTIYTFDGNKKIKSKKNTDVFEKLNIAKNIDTIIDTKKYRFVEFYNEKKELKYKVFLSNEIPFQINPLPGILPIELENYGGVFKLILFSEETIQTMELESLEKTEKNKDFEEDIAKVEAYEAEN